MEKYLILAIVVLIGFIIQLLIGYIGILTIALVAMGYLMIKLKQYKKVLGA